MLPTIVYDKSRADEIRQVGSTWPNSDCLPINDGHNTLAAAPTEQQIVESIIPVYDRRSERSCGKVAIGVGSRGITNIVSLSPPGFGSPSPAGWGATMYDYRDWLLNELNNIDGPIDLVAHDWGVGHTFSALAARPHIVRSWASDCIGLLHPRHHRP